MLTKLLYTKENKNTLIEFTRYKNSTYDYDFSRAEGGGDVTKNYQFWNGQPRHSTAIVYFDSFESRLNGQDFDTLLNLPKIFVSIMSDETQNSESAPAKPASRSKKNSEFLMNELSLYSKESVNEYIQSRLTARGQQEKSLDKIERHTIFQFVFNQIDLTMITLNSEPFLHAHVEGLRAKIHSIGKISTTYSVSFQTIKIVKPTEIDPKFKYDLSRKSELEREASGKLVDLFKPENSTSGEYVLRIMFDNTGQDSGLKADTRGSPTPNERVRKTATTTQVKNPWKKGAFILEQTVYKIEARDFMKASDLGLDPHWSVVGNLEIITKPFEVKVDLEIIKQVREYLLVREWNKIYKAILEKDNNEQQPVAVLYSALRREQWSFLQKARREHPGSEAGAGKRTVGRKQTKKTRPGTDRADLLQPNKLERD